MKILYCHNFYQIRSGEDIAAENDIKILRDRGIQVVEYVRSNNEIKKYGILEKALAPIRLLFSLKTFKEVSALIASEKPDVAVVQNVYPLISPSVYYALSARKVPIVQLVYNYRLTCANGSFFRDGKVCQLCMTGSSWNAVRFRCYRNSRVLSLLYAFTISIHRILGLGRKISAYVSPAKYVIECLERAGYPVGRMKRVLVPFDSNQFKVSVGGKGYFLFFGRTVREKGIFTFLDAARRSPELKFVIVGKGEADTEVTEIIRNQKLTNVSFLGPKYGEELNQIVEAATAIVTPVEWLEVSPLVVYQAFASGKPVISSKIQCMPELVQDHVTGLLFETGSAEDLVTKMKMLDGDAQLCARLGENARKFALEYLTADARFKQMSAIFSEVCET